MDKVPDCASVDKLELDMDNMDMDDEISSDDLGELRCSDLEVPLITLEFFQHVVSSYIRDFTNEQWMLLAGGQIDSDTIILLSDMCHEFIEEIIEWVLEIVEPQVQSGMCGQTAQEGNSNTSNTSITKNIETLQRNYQSLTEEDIQASIGNSLHCCFGEALGVEQERSQHSDMLLELLAAEVKKRVNRSLAVSRCQSQGSAESDTSTASHTEDMVYYIAHILKCLIKKHPESPENEECLGTDSLESSSPDKVENVEELSPDKVTDVEELSPDKVTDVEELSPDKVTNVEELSPDKVMNIEELSPDKVMNIEELSPEDAVVIASGLEKQSPDLPGCQSVKRSDSSAKELPQQDKTFLAVFLGKLLDHIADSTKTSVCDVDFDEMLKRLRERTGGKISSTLPQTVGNIHIPIYEELCEDFGSAKLLQAAMVSSDVTFEEAVAGTLKAHLHKSSRKTCSFVTEVKRFFARRTSKVAPACEVNTSVSHSEVINLENGSTPPPQKKQKCPAIMRMFSSAARILRKPFTSFISDGPQDC